MPANTSDYQKQYRDRNKNRTKNVTVTVPLSQHQAFAKFAGKQGISLSALMREATDLQIRRSQMKSQALMAEVQELKFLVSNISNNVNQMAHHSNRVREVVDANQLFNRLRELDELITHFVDTRLHQLP